MTQYFECRINKNAPLQTVFLVILPNSDGLTAELTIV